MVSKGGCRGRWVLPFVIAAQFRLSTPGPSLTWGAEGRRAFVAADTAAAGAHSCSRCYHVPENRHSPTRPVFIASLAELKTGSSDFEMNIDNNKQSDASPASEHSGKLYPGQVLQCPLASTQGLALVSPAHAAVQAGSAVCLLRHNR